MMRSMPAAWCSGQSGTPMMIAEQFGTEIIPVMSLQVARLISGTTSGTSAFMRNAEELSDHHRAGLFAGLREFARARGPGR